jgi:hypothetical protein
MDLDDNGPPLAADELEDALGRDALRGADLRHANLGNANLSGADLSHANLRHADLRHADLRRADLRHANLWVANLSGANLSHANLRHADLRHADLSGAKINWESHDLVAELIRREAGENVERRKIAGMVLISTGWCWNEFLALGDPQTGWALEVLRGYVIEGDYAPKWLKAEGDVLKP